MMIDVFLPIALYGMLAGVALASVWRDTCLRPVGLALCFSFIVSNIAFFAVSVPQRPGIFTMTEVVVSTVAYIAWMDCKTRALIALVITSVMSICANVAFAATAGNLYAYNLATNVLFVVECLIIIGVGVALRVGVDRVARRPRLCWLFAQRNAVEGAER